MASPDFTLWVTIESKADGTKVLKVGDRINYVKHPGGTCQSLKNPPAIRPGQDQEPGAMSRPGE